MLRAWRCSMLPRTYSRPIVLNYKRNKVRLHAAQYHHCQGTGFGPVKLDRRRASVHSSTTFCDVRVRKPAGHLGCLRVFPRTAAADARLPATRTCPVGHRRPRGLFVPLHSVPGEYARGRLSSPTSINGRTHNDNGAVGMGNNVQHGKEKM